MMYTMMGYGMGYGFGWIYPLLIFIGFFLVVWWLIKQNPQGVSSDKPLVILQRRLARGEITPKEYNALKKELED